VSGRFDTRLPAASGLVLPRCETCGHVNYPPRELCGRCLADALRWQPVDDGGVLLARTELHYSLEQDYAANLPWSIGSVQLTCGPVVLAHLQPGVAAGAPVNVVIVEDRHGNRMLAARDPQLAAAGRDWLSSIQFKECSP
jgi:uncharacterized OB-fold protein